jgi:hypothetical protein
MSGDGMDIDQDDIDRAWAEFHRQLFTPHTHEEMEEINRLAQESWDEEPWGGTDE